MPVSVGGESLDDVIKNSKAQHSCLHRMDEFMFCMSVTNQVTTYYRTGQYGDCPALLKQWQTCMKSKVSKAEDAAALMLEEQREILPGEHVFAFRPEYAQEANKRYGIPVRKPPDPNASTLPS